MRTNRLGRFILGYRGVDQVLLALVWVSVGLSLVLGSDPDPEHTTLLELVFPPHGRAALWFISAVAVLVLTAWWPPVADKYGFVILVIPAATRAVAYVFATVAGVLTGNGIGFAGAWLDAITWLIITWFVMRQARRPEPIETAIFKVDPK